jgi:hypothetical protein
VRELLRRVDCMPAILLGNVSCFAQQLKDCLTSFVQLAIVVSLALSRSFKWNHFGAHVLPFPVALFSNVYRLLCARMWQSVDI